MLRVFYTNNAIADVQVRRRVYIASVSAECYDLNKNRYEKMSEHYS